MALLHLIDQISSALDNNEFALGIFLDPSKAFHTLNHDVLLLKLFRYGFQGDFYKWLKSYVVNRSQFVYFSKCMRHKAVMTFGVAQGSVLGPLLFLIYINDLAIVSSSISLILFADDTNLFLSHKHFETLITEANSGLLAYSKWFQLNKLSLNIEKTNNIIFAGRKHFHDAKVFIEGKEIQRIYSTPFLGVIVDEKSSWKEHIDFVSKKMSKSVGIIRMVH